MDSVAATGEASSVSVAKKPTAKERLEAEIHARIQQTRKNLELAASANEEGNESDNHGSEGGIPPEVAAEDAREATREVDRVAYEERMHDFKRERLEEEAADEAAELDNDGSNVEEVVGAFSMYALRQMI
jgi:hypothetical protein